MGHKPDDHEEQSQNQLMMLVKMPLEGFGVFQVPDPAVCNQAVLDAFQTVYL